MVALHLVHWTIRSSAQRWPFAVRTVSKTVRLCFWSDLYGLFILQQWLKDPNIMCQLRWALITDTKSTWEHNLFPLMITVAFRSINSLKGKTSGCPFSIRIHLTYGSYSPATKGAFILCLQISNFALKPKAACTWFSFFVEPSIRTVKGQILTL